MTTSLKSAITPHQDAETTYLINPDSGILQKTVETLQTATHWDGDLRILGEETRISELLKTFVLATEVAGLIEADRAAIRTREGYDRNSAIVSRAGISFWMQTRDDTMPVFEGADDGLQSLLDALTEEWKSGEPYSIRTPGRPRLRETMDDELSENFRRDFDEIVEEADGLPASGGEVNVVTAALIAAARNQLLFYDLSHWGEDVGLASIATFTRMKQRLEDKGVIETSKVPIDVGRPRLRLHLVDEKADFLTKAVATTGPR